MDFLWWGGRENLDIYSMALFLSLLCLLIHPNGSHQPHCPAIMPSLCYGLYSKYVTKLNTSLFKLLLKCLVMRKVPITENR